MTKYHLRYFWGAFTFLFVCLTLITAPATAQTPVTPQTFRVIVGVNAPFRPEGELAGANAVTWQRFSIANRQQMLLDALRQMNLSANDIKRFQTIPFLALEVDAAGLLALQLNPNVTEIREDRISRIDTSSANTVVNATTAWNVGYDGRGYAIAILDTGVDFTHPALTNKRLENTEGCFGSFNSSPGNLYHSYPACPNGTGTQTGFGASYPQLPPQCYDCDHGTHVAGIAAGNGAGQEGVHENFRGVAPGAMLIGVNVFSIFTSPSFCGGSAFTPCTASYDSDQIRGMEHVYNLRTTYNIASVNMSLGGGNYTTECNSSASGSYLTVVSNLKSARIAVIAASGNEGRTNGMGAPACLSDVISVGASCETRIPADTNFPPTTCAGLDTVASFSNSASFLDLLAPGVSITSTLPGGGYTSLPGTSMATPYVAGAWAIMRQAYPTASVDFILNQLKTYGVPVLDGRNGITTSRINIGNSIPTPGEIEFATSSSSRSEGLSHSVSISLSLGSGVINLPSPFTVNLNYTGSATLNIDYTAPNSVTFTRTGGWAPNTTYPSEATIQLQILSDDVIDANESIIISLTSPSNVPVTVDVPGSHTVTIINTNIQATGVINFNSSGVSAGEYGEYGFTNNILVPVTMTVINGTPNISGTVNFNIVYGGTAIQGVDYTAPTSIAFDGTNFGAGTHTVFVPVSILARSGLQGTRQITLALQEPPHVHVGLGITQPNTTVNIIEGTQIRMTENELRFEMMALLGAENSINSVLPDFIAGSGINMVVILDDGTVGTVAMTMTSQNGAHRVILGAMTVDGAPAPSSFVDVVNAELSNLMIRAINNFLIARTGSSQRLELSQVAESDLIFSYLP